ncbi:hypothetical protein ULMA_09520 [Patiriisocius marinus]|uniref:NlpE C-terminal OB domain-containing protein n=1 Tax=Patiriisocius marinus TaxID=1397112 RepID=A0A5J4IVG3_9FLAO|nr:hypothetical protein [Patiriisocius marinus]GER58844.1 hypothetical protein ULMA_09520 [Patiriisocius marinus]
MKKILVLIAFIIAVSACKNPDKKEVSEELLTTKNSNLAVYKGEFIYVADAAVLKGKDFIYGVEVNEKMHELAEKVAPVKNDDFDMVPVVVTGLLNDKEEGVEGWDKILTIVEIIQVSPKPSKADVKIENKTAKAKK